MARVLYLTRAELRPRLAAAQSMPQPLKMSMKIREIVLTPKMHRHLYSNNRDSVTEANGSVTFYCKTDGSGFSCFDHVYNALHSQYL